LSQLPQLKVRKQATVADAKRAFDFVDKNRANYLPKPNVLKNLSAILNTFIISNLPCSSDRLKLLEDLVGKCLVWLE